MNGYNFTERVRKVLAMAREEAQRLHHEYVGTEHILLGLIREGEGVAAAVLQNLNVDLDEIQQKIEETVKKGKAAQTTGPDLPYTSRAKKVLELAMGEARELNHRYVGHRAPAARPAARGEGDCGAGAHRCRGEPRRRARRDAAPAGHRDAAARAATTRRSRGARRRPRRRPRARRSPRRRRSTTSAATSRSSPPRGSSTRRSVAPRRSSA